MLKSGTAVASLLASHLYTAPLSDSSSSTSSSDSELVPVVLVCEAVSFVSPLNHSRVARGLPPELLHVNRCCSPFCSWRLPSYPMMIGAPGGPGVYIILDVLQFSVIVIRVGQITYFCSTA